MNYSKEEAARNIYFQLKTLKHNAWIARLDNKRKHNTEAHQKAKTDFDFYSQLLNKFVDVCGEFEVYEIFD